MQLIQLNIAGQIVMEFISEGSLCSAGWRCFRLRLVSTGLYIRYIVFFFKMIRSHLLEADFHHIQNLTAFAFQSEDNMQNIFLAFLICFYSQVEALS